MQDDYCDSENELVTSSKVDRTKEVRETREDEKITSGIATLSVGLMTGREKKIVDMLKRRKIELLCIQKPRRVKSQETG